MHMPLSRYSRGSIFKTTKNRGLSMMRTLHMQSSFLCLRCVPLPAQTKVRPVDELQAILNSGRNVELQPGPVS